MSTQHPIDLTITLPEGSEPDGPGLAGYLEDDLRTRGEVQSAEPTKLVIHAYHREEVEAIGDELVDKLIDLGLSDGVTVTWTGDDGERTLRPSDAM